MGKILTIAVAFVLICAAWGCNTNGCMQNQSCIPLAGFYSSSTGKAIRIDSIDIYGVGAKGDSSLLDNISASLVYLPLRSDISSTSFCFRYLQKDLDFPELNDTLTLFYTSEPRFVSEECGAMYFYTVTDMAYTTHLIDSVSLLSPLIDNFDTERIKIFFFTAADTTASDTIRDEGSPL